MHNDIEYAFHMDCESESSRKFPFTSSSDQPAIRVKPRISMSINKKVLRSLGNPQNIQFLWSESQRVLLIEGVLEENRYTLKVSTYCYSRRGNMLLRRSAFLNTLVSLTKWTDHMVYAVRGKYIPELNMVAFHICDAIELAMDANE